MSKLSPFDITKTINMKSGKLEVDKDFNVFITNKIYSNTEDSVFYANEANQFNSNIDPQMVYDFYYHGLPRANRFGKWFKDNKDFSQDMIDYIKNYFNYNTNKAISILNLLDEDTLKEIEYDIEILKNPSARLKKNKKK